MSEAAPHLIEPHASGFEIECPILAVWTFIRVIIELMITPLANHMGALSWFASICLLPKTEPA
jgi:hypothetical protein